MNLIKEIKLLKHTLYLVIFLDTSIVNKLVKLFDDKYNGPDKIVNYIKDQFINEGISLDNIDIRSYAYEENIENEDPTLHISIFKNTEEYIHLSIHLRITRLVPKKTGIIHFSKNIYKPKNKNELKSIPKHNFYALISVEQDINKQKSLQFKIANGYSTPNIIKNKNKYDNELQQFMRIIITVLNKLFDEDDELYVGINSNLYSVYNKTNNFLKYINTSKVTRKNRYSTTMPRITNNTLLTLTNRKYSKPRSSNFTRKFRKL
jgi:hypothetical protein